MTKAELAKEISLKTGTDKKEALQIIECLMETIKTSMTNGEEVFLRGFGSFIIKRRAEKTARDISKNTTIVVPAHDVPMFRPAKESLEKLKR